jgi:hypothetical protein
VGIAEGVRKVNDASETIAELQRIQRQFEENGVSADMDVEMAMSNGRLQPVVKNIRLRTGDRPTTGLFLKLPLRAWLT